MPPLTTNNSPLTCTYDSWNRLISVTSVTSVVKYSYDADWKRIKKALADSSTEYYYDDMQLVETRTNGVASEQYVYDTRYLHSVTCRDILAPESSLRARYFPVNDANFNVTSLIKTNGAVVERYTYDPYGNVTFRTGDWNPITWDSSTKNIILYTGHKYDSETGLYYSLYRYYHPGLGRWATRDPLAETRDNLALRGVFGKKILKQYFDGYSKTSLWVFNNNINELNLTMFAQNGPITAIDVLGLSVGMPWEWILGEFVDIGANAVSKYNLCNKIQQCKTSGDCIECCTTVTATQLGIAYTTVYAGDAWCAALGNPWYVFPCLIAVNTAYWHTSEGIVTGQVACDAKCHKLPVVRENCPNCHKGK